MKNLFPLAALVVTLLASPAMAGQVAAAEPSDSGPRWPQWRGPNRDGHAATVDLAGWPEGGPEEIWRRPLGEGFSAIAIADGRVFTLFATGRSEYLVALDARNGSELWRFPMGQALIDGNGNGPRSTPAIADGLVYAFGSRGKLVAVAVDDGRPVWQRALEEPPRWGYSSSPLVAGDLVIVHARPAVLAVDRKTGKPAWEAAAGHPGYASPIAVTLGGEPQIVSFIATGLVGLAADTGRERWQQPWTTSYDANIADPIFLPPDRIFLSSGYGEGALLVEVRKSGQDFGVRVVWRSKAMANHFNSSVVVGKYIYGFNQSSLTCLAVVTGDARWQERGLGKGSLIAAGQKLVVLGERGVLVLVAASAEAYRELGRAQVLKGRCWTTPTLAGQRLYLRNQEEIVCLNLRAANGD